MANGLIGSVVSLMLAGFGCVAWFVRRRITNAKEVEQANYLNSVADLMQKLTAEGKSVDELRDFGDLLRSERMTGSPSVGKIIESSGDDVQSEPEAFQTTYGMRTRVDADLQVAEARLNKVLADIGLLVGEGLQTKLEAVQLQWKKYRKALSDYELEQYTGGTLAPLAASLAMLAETERRCAELEAEAERLKTR